ncbi:MAG: pantoate--beta-alanine ligase [Candidatus Limnocylindria bacterium]
MKTLRTVAEVRKALDEPRRSGTSIGLVPTMGAFHDGHVALMRAARERTDLVVVSLFLNPAQFTAADDLARYPRDEKRDAKIAKKAGAHVLFAPTPDELYPPGFNTWVDPGALALRLEGAARPGHFRAVATVCMKLFDVVQPDVAFFDRKDAQQLAVIRQVVRDLNLPVEIVAVPTVRDTDGLALSSRNAYLSPEERVSSAALPRALQAGAHAYRSGADPVDAAHAVLRGMPELRVEYVEVTELDGPTLVAAVRIGSTRLIDNIPLSR